MVLPKPMRIKGYKCFDYLYKQGNRFHGSYMTLRVAAGNLKLQTSKNHYIRENQIKCAISISSKVSKKAVVRNSLRRLFHDHLRLRLFLSSSQNYETWAFISLKPCCRKENSSNLLKECDHLLFKAGLIP